MLERQANSSGEVTSREAADQKRKGVKTPPHKETPVDDAIELPRLSTGRTRITQGAGEASQLQRRVTSREAAGQKRRGGKTPQHNETSVDDAIELPCLSTGRTRITLGAGDASQPSSHNGVTSQETGGRER